TLIMIYTIFNMKFNRLKYIAFPLAGIITIAISAGILSKPSLAPETISGSKLISSENLPNEQTFPITSPAPIDDHKVAAKSYIVFDTPTGRVLARRSAATSLPIASVTQLLTG